MKFEVTASIVLYNNPQHMLIQSINSFLNSTLLIKLYLIDNSPTNSLKDIISDPRVEYIHNPSNPGFGAGHNIAIRKALDVSPFHLVLNPDIFFDNGVIERLLSFMALNTDVGVVMPKVLYPDGSLQYVARLLPSPIDLIIRRLIPLKYIKDKVDERYELRGTKYNKTIEVPFLSGCFMLFRMDVLKGISGFDEKIFMYTEDIDICRRVMNSGYKSLFYPEVSVFHDHEKKSFMQYNTFRVYLKSAVYYFNKWGWLFDAERSRINKKTIRQIKI
ncbi:glycosyltransferase family 2 protein [Pedobacter sp. GR22-6]|uniref:glycosyltransferase family 2 protein n=1 Tax=Pedobacter sp. GR22-6 TaxID=3127957 RepID=UPI00307D871E